MPHLPGSLVRFKASPNGPVATVGNKRFIGEVAYFSVAWTDERGSFMITELPGDVLIADSKPPFIKAPRPKQREDGGLDSITQRLAKVG